MQGVWLLFRHKLWYYDGDLLGGTMKMADRNARPQLVMSIHEALSRIGSPPFSVSAVEDYKQRQLLALIGRNGYLVRYLYFHPRLRKEIWKSISRLFQIAGDLFWFAVITFVLGFGLGMAAQVFCFIVNLTFGTQWTFSIFGAIAINASKTLGITAGFGVILWAIAFVLDRGLGRLSKGTAACWSEVELDYFAKTNPVPNHAETLRKKIQQLVPNANFFVDWLSEDPLLVVKNSSNTETCVPYGWNGQCELVETDGRLVEMAPFD